MKQKYKIGERVVAYAIDQDGDELLIVGRLSPVVMYDEKSRVYDFGIHPEYELSKCRGYEGIINIFNHDIVGYVSKEENIEKKTKRLS